MKCFRIGVNRFFSLIVFFSPNIKRHFEFESLLGKGKKRGEHLISLKQSSKQYNVCYYLILTQCGVLGRIGEGKKRIQKIEIFLIFMASLYENVRTKFYIHVRPNHVITYIELCYFSYCHISIMGEHQYFWYQSRLTHV